MTGWQCSTARAAGLKMVRNDAETDDAPSALHHRTIFDSRILLLYLVSQREEVKPDRI